jgi:hypothetical protein
MPKPGDSCGRDDRVTMSDSGEVLVCRRGTWQRVGEAAPIDLGAVPSRGRTKRLVEEQRKDDAQRPRRRRGRVDG